MAGPEARDARRPLGLILAGGLARRMGGRDKTLSQVGGRTILAHIVRVLEAQCDGLAISAPADAGRFGLDVSLVLPDPIAGRPGPLAGVLAGLRYLAAMGRTNQLLLSVPGDTPFLPPDLVAHLASARTASGAMTAMAASRGRVHPVVALWPVSVCARLEEALLVRNIRGVGAFHQAIGSAVADWPDGPIDPFFNVNTPDDLAEAERVARLFGS